MKRCPQCEFIYPDRDNECDFDQTPLIPATESEIAALTNTPQRPALTDLAVTHSRKFERRRNRRALPFAAALGLLLGLAIVAAFFAAYRRTAPPTVEQAAVKIGQPQNVPSPSSPPPASTTESTLPDLVVNEERRTTTSKAAHSSARLGPVSSGPPRTDMNSERKPVIILTSGGKVEADAVWRTKDGIWYRRNGIVTLLKANRVRAIVGH